jgi:hypothetical protein
MRTLIVLACIATAVNGQAQNPPTIFLSKPTARSAEGFTEIVAAREIPDGRILAADMRETRLALIDFTASSVRDVSRDGPGPLEFTGTFSVIRWLGDTTLVYGRRDLLKISPSGIPVGKIAVNMPQGGGGLGAPYYADREGRLYFEVTPPLARSADGSFTAPIDAAVIRWDPRTNRIDTTARLQHRDPKWKMYRYWRPFARHDGAAVLPDGGVMIIRAQAYHAELWRNGKVAITGPLQNVPAIPVTAAERDAFRDEQASRPAGGAGIGNAPIRLNRISDADRAARRKALDLPDEAFPNEMSPIVEFRSTIVDLAGNVWVARSFSSKEKDRLYDVFDQRCNVIRRVVVPNRGRVVGFGKGIVLVATRDDDDVEWIEKYAND